MRSLVFILLIIMIIAGAVVYSAPSIKVNGDGSISINDYNETFRVYVRVIGDNRFVYYGEYFNNTNITLPTGKYEIIIEDSSGNHSFIIENKLKTNSLVDTVMSNPLPFTLFMLFTGLFTWRKSIITLSLSLIFTIHMLMSYSFDTITAGMIFLGWLLYTFILIIYRK